MSKKTAPTAPAISVQQPQEIKTLCQDIINKFNHSRSKRALFEQRWEEIARYIWPTMVHTFKPALQFRTPGEDLTFLQMDSTAEQALGQFSSILDSLLTPRTQRWHVLSTNNPEINKDRSAKLYFEAATNVLFAARENAISNFPQQNLLRYKSQGAFGTGTTFVDALRGRNEKGIRYKTPPVGEIFVAENHQGIVDTVDRCFPMTIRQLAQRFGKEALPMEMLRILETNPENVEWVLHCVQPREDYDEGKIDAKNKPIADYYILLNKGWLLEEGGYNRMPYVVSRYDVAPGEDYGRSPAMMALPSIRVLQDMKATILKVGHQAGDPTLLLPDDGIIDMQNARPGAWVMGGMSADGKPLVGRLPAGDPKITLEMMEQEIKTIQDIFLVSMMSILTDTPDRMTAYEVQQRTAEKGILLAPTVGGQFTSLGVLIERELDVAASQGMLPEMPDILKEAAGEYHVTYTSPMARMMKAQEVAGMVQSFQTAALLANATGDPSIMDSYNTDVILPAMAEIDGVPVSWMRNAAELQKKKNERAQQQQIENQTAAAPGVAALMQGQAAQKKAGLPV